MITNCGCSTSHLGLVSPPQFAAASGGSPRREVGAVAPAAALSGRCAYPGQAHYLVDLATAGAAVGRPVILMMLCGLSIVWVRRSSLTSRMMFDVKSVPA